MTAISKSGSNSAIHPAWQGLGPVRGGADDPSETLPEQIARRIAAVIEDGAVEVGARLPSERELARIFGVSRLAVREAAHRLEARGLVAVRRGAGSFVSLPTAPAADSHQSSPPPVVALDAVADVRMLLETAAADWAARRAEPSSLAILKRIAGRFEQAASSPEPRVELLAASDVELHLEIAHAADNPLLAHLVAQALDLQRLQLEWSLRRPGRLEHVAAEHRRLVDAIAAGQPRSARDAMADHLAAAAASFRALGDRPSAD